MGWLVGEGWTWGVGGMGWGVVGWGEGRVGVGEEVGEIVGGGWVEVGGEVE